jgi:hypothetical protein
LYLGATTCVLWIGERSERRPYVPVLIDVTAFPAVMFSVIVNRS